MIIAKRNIRYTFSSLLISLAISGQNVISSSVYNSLTMEPIPYVNIGIKNKKTGTISYSNGSFQISISDDKKRDSITFSSIGYHSISISINNLILNRPDSIFMSQKPIQLSEVEVKGNGKWQSESLGVTRHLPGVFGLAQSDTLFDIVECAQQLDLGEDLTKISTFHIYLKEVNTDTGSFRINFYKFNESGSFELAYQREIFSRKKISNGWLDVDLNEYDIWLKGKVIVGIEFLPSDDQRERISLSYGGILVCKGTSYNRGSSNGAWNKLDFGTYSIYVTIKKFAEKKQIEKRKYESE
jgi:hypothetical protein